MNILCDLEQKHKLKPVEMAKKLGISKSYYTMIRKNDRQISKGVAIKLKNVFGVTTDDSLCPAVHGEKTKDPPQQRAG